ncbi:type II toxin-antitoxin system RelE/ParE family toxin [Methylorubrum sp. B1-46]|jgi:mRNA interferase RelE/StbE|uniref:type II toxin-antitoxin system RelE family toxin n=1 Tax=Methylorubrum sp. B1-46 TaxID=2897334 RepID=UPI001E308B44|nr:type II toxin-antitoxin system RelE/ParE family toxin [Methylorubrum sp. B1-46]UGB25451.1 type II toxin-antitoxin system RelE/ParE family toxin [Methylorubrum sp. B1-46]
MAEVVYSKAAVQALIRLPADVSRKIRLKIEQYAADPASLANNVKALRGEPGILRLRVGDWRVLFTEEGVVIAVIRIAPRGDAYD